MRTTVTINLRIQNRFTEVATQCALYVSARSPRSALSSAHFLPRNKMVKSSILASRDKWVVGLIFLFYGCHNTLGDISTIWHDRDPEDERHRRAEYQTLNTSNWWDAGQECKEFGGQLYVPGAESISQDVIDALEEDEYYWVGAVKNSKWIWTSDASPLYTYVGYKPTPSMKKTHIHGNSAFQCHLECDDDSVVGLRGEECYCLSAAVQATSTNTSQIRCSGNFDQSCGNEDGMSLYAIVLDRAEIFLKEDGECGYAEKEWRGSISLHFDQNCDRERSLACPEPLQDSTRCRGTVCVNNDEMTWDEANRTHPLLKVNNTNRLDLHNAMGRWWSYWIGLRRKYFCKWINGQDVSTDYDGSDLSEACLTVRKLGDQSSPLVRFTWLPCDEEMLSLCESVKPGTTYVPEPQPNTAEPPTSTGTNHTELYGPIKGSAGVYIGAAVGCVAAVICCIVLVLFIRRKKKFCFVEKSDTQTPVFSNPTAESTTYCLTTSTDPYYSMPNPPEGQLPDPSLTKSIHDQKSSDPYYSTLAVQEKPAPPTAVVMPYRPSEQTLYVNSPETAKEGVYNKLSDTENPNTDSTGNAYNHTSGLLQNSYKGEYDSAKALGDEDEGIQDHLHLGPPAEEEDDGIYNIPDYAEHQRADGDYDKANIKRYNLALTDSNTSQTSVTNSKSLVEPAPDSQASAPAQSVPEGSDDDSYEIPIEGTGNDSTVVNADTASISGNVDETDIYECIDNNNSGQTGRDEDDNATSEGDVSVCQDELEAATYSAEDWYKEDREHIYGNIESDSSTVGPVQDGHCYYNIVSDTNALSTQPSTYCIDDDNVYSLATHA
ncbi:uncharacterized protein LOC124285985 [Haliotis rubra]|uniref:uncharacterized protein LOC124285985 n=1 Tax=Haliotis rubra TaxID=36100 RepID=UPI001EE5A261|nr:uncharacterized protein LOC124285985 [Haliotis rubra]